MDNQEIKATEEIMETVSENAGVGGGTILIMGLAAVGTAYCVTKLVGYCKTGIRYIKDKTEARKAIVDLEDENYSEVSENIE